MSKSYGINIPKSRGKRRYQDNQGEFIEIPDPDTYGVREIYSGGVSDGRLAERGDSDGSNDGMRQRDSEGRYTESDNRDRNSRGRYTHHNPQEMQQSQDSYNQGYDQGYSDGGSGQSSHTREIVYMNPENQLQEGKNMADTVVTNVPAGGANGGYGAGYGGFPFMPWFPGMYGGYNNNQNDCLGEVILANQISSGVADGVAATTNGVQTVTDAVHSNGVRISDGLHTGFSTVMSELCDIKHLVSKEACDTRHLVQAGHAALSRQMSEQHCELKQIHLEERNQALRDRIQTLETQNLIQAAVAQATA